MLRYRLFPTTTAFLTLVMVVGFETPIATAQDKCAEVRLRIQQADSIRNGLGSELYRAQTMGPDSYLSDLERDLEGDRNLYSYWNRVVTNATDGNVLPELRSPSQIDQLVKGNNLPPDARYATDPVVLATAVRNSLLETVENRQDQIQRAGSLRQMLQEQIAVVERLEHDLDVCEDTAMPAAAPVPQPQPPPSGSNNSIFGNRRLWEGTWVDQTRQFTLTIGGQSGNLSITYSYNYPGAYWANATGSGTMSNCKIEASEGNCDWTEAMENDQTSISSKGTVRLNLGAEKLMVSPVLTDGSSVTWKGDGKPKYGVEIFSMMARPGNTYFFLTRP